MASRARAAGDAVLDYGCGSGILAIAAARLGAKRVVGTDIDQQAITASVDNARVNDVAAIFVLPDRLGDETFDIVVANILTNPLIVLAPALASRASDNGRIALAGILDAQASVVADAYSRWFNIAPWRTADGWSLLAGSRRSPVRRRLPLIAMPTADENTRAAPAARRCSASRRRNSRCATARCDAGIAARCSMATRR